MKAFLTYILQNIVRHPDYIRITEMCGDSSIMYELRVHPDDMGLIIGRKGRSIEAIKALLNAVGAKNGYRVVLSVSEDEKTRPIQNGEENGKTRNQEHRRARN